MAYQNDNNKDQTGSAVNAEILINILRIICMLEKKLDQIVRRTYHSRAQYPKIFFEIKSMLNVARSWIKKCGHFSNLPIFNILLSSYLKQVSMLIEQLIVICIPLKGKKGIKKEQPIKERKRFEKTIDNMLKNIGTYLCKLETNETETEIAAEKALIGAFENHCSQEHEQEIKKLVSGRGDKTYVFPWTDKVDYLALVDDPKRFQAEVVEKNKR